MGEETYSEGFVYDDHGRLTSKTVTQAGTETTVTNTYDALSRLSTRTGPVSKATYSYLAGANGTTTGLVSSVTHSKVGTNSFSPITFGYTYDKLGYITTYSQTGRIDTTYEYDQQGQLIQAMDNGECYNYSYTYDTVGNIRSLDAYCWGDSDYSYTNTYTYGNPKWLDLLTGFNDEPILYEGQSLVDGEILGDPVSGNPISYFNGTRWSFDWENGRQLATAEATDSTGTVDTLLSYEYDINGLRTSKTVTTNTYTLQEHTHNFTKTVVKEPTCTAAGSNLYTCSCGYSYEEHMPALGHVLMLVQNVYRCKRCGYEQQPVVIGPIQPPVDPPISTASVEQEDATAMSAEREEVTTLRVLASTVTEHHDYVYASGKLLREVITRTDADGNVTTEVLDFTYDASGNPYALTYTNGTETPVTYYYVVNPQGDVIRLVSTNGASVAQYWYGPYGEVRQAFGAMAEANPLRYRSYYYDGDTEFYYLQSRYYDPCICRFINVDAFASTGQGFLGYNMFAYCGNNPVNRKDPTGQFGITALIITAVVAVCGVVLSGCTAQPSTPSNYVQENSTNQNCYSYAFDLPHSANPGDYSASDNSDYMFKDKNIYTPAEITGFIERDMDALNKSVRVVDSPKDKLENEYIVAMKTSTIVIPSIGVADYHFAVQLSDGSWADKPGQSPSRWNVLDGTEIAWDLGNIKNYYNTETVYFAVER